MTDEERIREKIAAHAIEEAAIIAQNKMGDVRPVGRPTKYKDEFCEEIVRLSKLEEGRHMYRIARIFDVGAGTLQDWANTIPEFSTAYARAREEQICQLFDLVYENITNRDLNAQALNLLFRHQAKMAEQRLLKIRNIGKGTLVDKVNATFRECEGEGMSADELNKTLSAISTAAKVEEVTELRKELIDIREALEEKAK